MRAMDVNHLPPEPTTLREAQASPKWPNWQRARKRKMGGQLARQIWEVISRPKGKTVLGTKTIFKQKIGKDGRIEKYKCRFVAQRFRQIKGIHYDESLSPTPSQASIRMVLGIAAVKDWELRQLDVDMAYLEANVKEELYISSYLKTTATPATRRADCKRQCTALCTPDYYGRKHSAPNSPQGGSSIDRPIKRVQVSTARESRRHHRGIRR